METMPNNHKNVKKIFKTRKTWFLAIHKIKMADIYLKISDVKQSQTNFKASKME